jgi:hypothetical protein
VYRLTQGHPFYADVTCRETGVAALRLDQVISASMVDGAFIDAVRRPPGQIAIACREMFDSLGDRAPALRGMLQSLAVDEPAGPTELAERMQLASVPTLYRYAEELQRLGMIQELTNGVDACAHKCQRGARAAPANLRRHCVTRCHIRCRTAFKPAGTWMRRARCAPGSAAPDDR